MKVRNNVVTLMLAITGLAAATGCHERPTIERPKPAEGTERHPLGDPSVAAPGVVEPWGGEVRVASTEPGAIVALLADEGRTVKKGDLLARLEDSTQRHSVSVVEAELHAAEAALGGLPATPEEVRAAEAELRAATARAEQRRRESERAEALGQAGALPTEEVERAASSAEVDEAAYGVAAARLALAQRGARRSERRVAEARVQAAKARLAEAQAALARREVRAPSEGVVLWSRYHEGEFYTPSERPLFVLGNVQRLQVRLELDDADVGALLPGARCEFRSDDGRRLGDGSLVRVAAEYGSRTLATERPTARTDARVREGFVEAARPATLAPGQRVWGYCPRGVVLASR